jgi:dTMP kinase
MRTHGLIVAICGVDGVGKSTLYQGLRGRLVDRGDTIEFFTREKEDTDRLSLTNKYVLPSVQDEQPWLSGHFATIVGDGLLLDFLDSYQRRLLPAFEAGRVVVCDRYTPCFFAYIRAVSAHPVFEQVLQLQRPDLVLYLSAPAALLAERHTGRGGRQADEDPILQQHFDCAYRNYFASQQMNWVEIDAAQAPELVLQQSVEAIEELFEIDERELYA